MTLPLTDPSALLDRLFDCLAAESRALANRDLSLIVGLAPEKAALLNELNSTEISNAQTADSGRLKEKIFQIKTLAEQNAAKLRTASEHVQAARWRLAQLAAAVNEFGGYQADGGKLKSFEKFSLSTKV